jgi:competence protein ComEA
MFKVIVGVLFFTIVSLLVFVNLDPNISSLNQTVSGSVQEGYVTLTLSGEVNKSGTYLVTRGGSLFEAITLAGGVTQNADEDAFFPGLVVEQGKSYYIAPLYDPNDVCMSTKLEKVGLNSAPASELTKLSNIGDSIANAILSYRQQHGSFTHLEQVMLVSGIGQATFTRIRNHITLA